MLKKLRQVLLESQNVMLTNRRPWNRDRNSIFVSEFIEKLY